MRNFGRAAAVAAVLCGAAGAARADTFKAPTEEYPTIQSAINAAGVGDRVLILKGVHPESILVDGKSGLEIRGSGNPTLQGVTVVGVNQGVLRGFTVVEGGCQVEDSEEVLLSKITVLDAPLHGIHVNESSHVRIEKCHVDGAGGHGIYVEDSSRAYALKSLLESVEQDAIRGHVADGDWLEGEGFVADKNRVLGAENGIVATGNGILISNNRLEGIGIFGITILDPPGSSGAVVLKNRMAESPSASGGILIDGNYGLVASNRLSGNGIFENGGQGNRIERNQVAGADTGILCEGQYTVLYRNSVRDCDTGIEVRSPFSTLDYNRVSFPNIFGIRVTGDGNVSTYRNRVSGAAGRGIMVETDGNFFHKDTCRGSGTEDYTDIFPIGTNSLEGCSFGTSSFDFFF